MKRIKLFFIIGISAIVCLLLSSCVCDTFPHFKGTVYEWVNAPSGEQGEIFVDSEPPNGMNLEPIGYAHVSFYFENIPPMGPSCSAARQKEKYILLYDISCDSNGMFEKSGTLACGNYPLKIKGEMEGYYSTEKVFTYHGDSTFKIILVRKT